MAKMYSNGDRVLKALLYFTWILCLIMLLASIVIIPFFFKQETLLNRAIMYCMHVNDKVTQEQIRKIEQFNVYMQENRYLSSNLQ